MNRSPTRRVLSSAVASVVAAIFSHQASAQIRSFGEAEGYGAVATGGRGGSIYHVTNLSDSGTGSFRDAVSQPNRIVVFDVGGNISLGSSVAFSSNITIAGQTAPGGGVQITGHEVSLGSQSNIIIRHVRFRPGDVASDTENGINLHNASKVVLDHVSVQFAGWNNIDAVDDNHTGSQFTIQNSLLADPINQQFVAHTESVDGAFTWSNNLLANSHNRTPMAKFDTVFKNNVAYNYQGGYTVSDTATPFSHDFVNNYYITGPASSTSPSNVLYDFNTGQTVYASGNLFDNNSDGNLNGSTFNPSGSSMVLTGTPWSPQTTNLPMMSAADAYAYVMAHAGASLTRDELDALVVSQVATLGNAPAGWTSGTAGPDGNLYHHASETTLSNGGLGSISTSSRPAGFDTDNDGVPDTWETAHGMNPANAADALALNPLGYRMIEQYFDELGDENVTNLWTGSNTLAAYEHAQIRGDGVNNGSVSLASGTVTALSLSIGGNGPAAGESLTVSGTGKLDIYDTVTVGDQNNATLNITGGTVDAYNIVLGNTVYSPAATNYNGVLNLSGGTLLVSSLVQAAGTPGNWNAGGTVNFTGGIIKASAQLNVTAPITISGGGGTFDTNGNDGTISGAISGSGAVTKIGNGALNLTGANSFTGGVFLRQGSLGGGSDANLGGATSAITFQGGFLRINGTSLTSIDSHVVNWSTFNGGFDIATATHTFNVNSNISGGGSLTKIGAGVLQLNGTNTYTGGTILKAGAVAISNDANIGGAGSSISFQGGSLKILGTTLANLDNHAVNWSSFNGGFDIATATHTFVINQLIAGSGGLIKDGPGTLVLNAANTFTGNTIINAGVLKLGNPLAIQFSTLNFPTSGGGVLDLNGFSLSIGGIAGNGGFDLKGGTLTVGSNNLSTTFSGVISDSVGGGKLVKVGSGVLTLTGNSSSNFNILVDAGGVGFNANVPSSGASPFGTASNGVILDGGKIARTSPAGAAWDRLFTLGPGGGTLEGSTGYVKFNSTGTVPFSSTGNSTLTFAGSQQDNEFHFQLVDPTGGKLAVNFTGPGRWIDTVASAQAWTYSGDTTISGGTLIANNSSNTLPFGPGKGNLVINSGTFDMSDRSFNINGLNGGSGGRIYQRNANKTVTLTLGNGDANGSYPGQILDVSGGTINLVKTGTGKQILSGSNSYAGSTTVNGGVLQFNTSGSIGGSGSSVTIATGAAAAAGYAIDQAFITRTNPASTGAVALAVNSSNALNFSNLPNVSLGAIGSATYSGTLTPNGSTYRLGTAAAGGGTLNLPNTNALTSARNLIVSGGTVKLLGTNNYTGGTTVNAGLLIAPRLSNGSLTINAGTVQLTAKPQANDPTGTTLVPSLTIAATGASLDLTNNSFVIDYTAPVGGLLDQVRQHLQSGRITSSVADATHKLGYADNAVLNLSTFSGQAVDSSSVLIKYTYAGDANLDGQVDVTDLGALATNWQTSTVWTGGDFNYDGFVDVTDLGALATNWQAGVGSGSPLSAASFDEALASVGLSNLSVPEPASIAVPITCVAALLSHRRRLGR